MPRRPWRASLRRNAVHNVSASEGPISTPRASRGPSLSTPTVRTPRPTRCGPARTLVEKTPDGDLLREMIGFAAQRLMELEVEGQTGAAYGEKNPERLAHSNGYRDRRPAPVRRRFIISSVIGGSLVALACRNPILLANSR